LVPSGHTVPKTSSDSGSYPRYDCGGNSVHEREFSDFICTRPRRRKYNGKPLIPLHPSSLPSCGAR
jgi:hypothetical protein